MNNRSQYYCASYDNCWNYGSSGVPAQYSNTLHVNQGVPGNYYPPQAPLYAASPSQVQRSASFSQNQDPCRNYERLPAVSAQRSSQQHYSAYPQATTAGASSAWCYVRVPLGSGDPTFRSPSGPYQTQSLPVNHVPFRALTEASYGQTFAPLAPTRTQVQNSYAYPFSYAQQAPLDTTQLQASAPYGAQAAPVPPAAPKPPSSAVFAENVSVEERLMVAIREATEQYQRAVTEAERKQYLSIVTNLSKVIGQSSERRGPGTHGTVPGNLQTTPNFSDVNASGNVSASANSVAFVTLPDVALPSIGYATAPAPPTSQCGNVAAAVAEHCRPQSYPVEFQGKGRPVIGSALSCTPPTPTVASKAPTPSPTQSSDSLFEQIVTSTPVQESTGEFRPEERMEPPVQTPSAPKPKSTLPTTASVSTTTTTVPTSSPRPTSENTTSCGAFVPTINVSTTSAQSAATSTDGAPGSCAAFVPTTKDCIAQSATKNTSVISRSSAAFVSATEAPTSQSTNTWLSLTSTSVTSRSAAFVPAAKTCIAQSTSITKGACSRKASAIIPKDLRIPPFIDRPRVVSRVLSTSPKVPCVMCKECVGKEHLEEHILGQHLKYYRYKCPEDDCQTMFADFDLLLYHSIECGHNISKHCVIRKRDEAVEEAGQQYLIESRELQKEGFPNGPLSEKGNPVRKPVSAENLRKGTSFPTSKHEQLASSRDNEKNLAVLTVERMKNIFSGRQVGGESQSFSLVQIDERTAAESVCAIADLFTSSRSNIL